MVNINSVFTTLPNVNYTNTKLWLFKPASPNDSGTNRQNAWAALVAGNNVNPCSPSNAGKFVEIVDGAPGAAISDYVTLSGRNATSLGTLDFDGTSSPGTPSDEYHFVLTTGPCNSSGCFDLEPFIIGYIRPLEVTLPSSLTNLCAISTGGNLQFDLTLSSLQTEIKNLNLQQFINISPTDDEEREYKIAVYLEFFSGTSTSPSSYIKLMTTSSGVVTATSGAAPSTVSSSSDTLKYVSPVTTNLQYATSTKIILGNTPTTNYPTSGILGINTGINASSVTYGLKIVICNTKLLSMSGCTQVFTTPSNVRGTITLAPNAGTATNTYTC